MRSPPDAPSTTFDNNSPSIRFGNQLSFPDQQLMALVWLPLFLKCCRRTVGNGGLGPNRWSRVGSNQVLEEENQESHREEASIQARAIRFAR